MAKETSSTTSKVASGRAMTVLVVDDDRDILEALTEALRDDGWTVIGVTSAAAALETLHRARVDVILADVLMPGQTGHSLHEAITSDPTLRRLPIAFMTASSIHARSLRAPGHARIVLEKPFDGESITPTLLALIANQPSSP
jgi:chemotaxis family two-component system response regulator PixH